MIDERHARQSFLGKNSEEVLMNSTVGIVGVGGGGSHIAQQLAHIGVGHIKIFDPDKFEPSNLNRTVGSRWLHQFLRWQKTTIAKWMIKCITPFCKVDTFNDKWQSHSHELRDCDVVIGCVDKYKERRELETSCRRFLIPYIDIGMDVSAYDKEFIISGQVILSFPGDSCMRCVGFLNDEIIAEEEARYGEAGAKPQVIWPNGLLASSAIGICIRLLTPWRQHLDQHDSIYLVYDGDRGTMIPSSNLKREPLGNCKHHNVSMRHDPTWVGIPKDFH